MSQLPPDPIETHSTSGMSFEIEEEEELDLSSEPHWQCINCWYIFDFPSEKSRVCPKCTWPVIRKYRRTSDYVNHLKAR